MAIEDHDILADLPPLSESSPAIHRVGDHAIRLLAAVQDLNDPELRWLAEQIAIHVGRRIAKDMMGH